jgi:hypothetical protein
MNETLNWLRATLPRPGQRMKRILATPLIAAVLALAPLFAGSAVAGHTGVSAYIYIHRDGTVLPTAYSGDASCTTTSCSVTVVMGSKRDYGRFLRWCGQATVAAFIAAGNQYGGNQCGGPSTWFIEYFAYLRDSNGFTTHPDQVTVLITVALP